ELGPRCVIQGWGRLRNVESSQACWRNATDDLEYFSRSHAAWSGCTCTGGVGSVKRVDVHSEIEAVLAANTFENLVDCPFGPMLPDFFKPDHSNAVIAAILSFGFRIHPSIDPHKYHLAWIVAVLHSTRDGAAVV